VIPTRIELAIVSDESRPALFAVSHRGSAAGELNDGLAFTVGEHIGSLYGSDSGRVALGVPFVLDGLREGSVVFLLGPSQSTREILDELASRRPELESDIEQGRLVVGEHQATGPHQLQYFQTRIAEAEKKGFDSFRLFADMIGIRANVGSDELGELEEGFEVQIIPNHRMVAMCAYDVRVFTGTEILAALKQHRDRSRH
jgi:transcriptional repressor of dcmA and dcmR